MIFKEVIEQILFERNIDYKELADELGISFLQVENLHSGTTKRPNERIYNKLVEYCDRHNIEIDINWNDVLYDIFSSCGWDKEYVWLRDLDEEDYVLLRHKTCGKKTKVPSSAFGGNSIPCIHCWVDKYVSTEAYSFNLSEDDYRHEFRHRCGNSYYVTYEEIKQKKFRCPTCAGYKYNAYNINKNRKNLDVSPAWHEKVKEQINRIALENDFSIEEKDSLHCKLIYPTMSNNQFVLICNKCITSEIFEKDDSAVDKIKAFISQHETECENIDRSIAEQTRVQEIVWIPDVERLLYMVSLSALNNNHMSEIIERLKTEEYSHEVYIAAIRNAKEDKTVYLFWHYYKDNDDKDYFDFLISLNPSNFADASIYGYPKVYTDKLYEQIKSSFSVKVWNTEELQHTCDEYVDIIHYFKQINPQIALGAAFARFADKMSAMLNPKELSNRQKDAERILIFQRCPVCQTYNNSSSSVCIECGFDEINKVFINKDEYELWLNDVVIPARKQREENN